jgi:hypothetical protein
MARDAVHRLLASDVALDKLGSRGISAQEAAQLRGIGTTRSETHARPASRASGGC